MVTFEEFKEKLENLPKNFIVLVTVDSKNYAKVNMETLRYLCNEKELHGIYITVNKPYDTIVKILQDNKINPKNLYFIDCITDMTAGKGIKESKKTDRVLYMDSPQNLTDLAVAISEAISNIKDEEKFLFMDSLSTFLIYNTVGTMAKFTHFMTGKMRLWGLRGILMSLEKEMDPTFISHISQFCDEVVSVEV